MPKKSAYTEKELVEGCVRNDRFFQERLYRQFYPSMRQMCYRYTHDEDTIMLIINDGFLRVFKKLHLFEFKGSLEGWIRKLVYHSLADHFKKNQKYIHFLVFEDRDEIIRETATSNMYLEDIHQMIRQLPNASANVFRKYAIEGYSHKEIALQLDISVGTSKWHLSNARKLLQEMIHNYNSSSTYAR